MGVVVQLGKTPREEGLRIGRKKGRNVFVMQIQKFVARGARSNEFLIPNSLVLEISSSKSWKKLVHTLLSKTCEERRGSSLKTICPSLMGFVANNPFPTVADTNFDSMGYDSS